MSATVDAAIETTVARTSTAQSPRIFVNRNLPGLSLLISNLTAMAPCSFLEQRKRYHRTVTERLGPPQGEQGPRGQLFRRGFARRGSSVHRVRAQIALGGTDDAHTVNERSFRKLCHICRRHAVAQPIAHEVTQPDH